MFVSCLVGTTSTRTTRQRKRSLFRICIASEWWSSSRPFQCRRKRWDRHIAIIIVLILLFMSFKVFGFYGMEQQMIRYSDVINVHIRPHRIKHIHGAVTSFSNNSAESEPNRRRRQQQQQQSSVLKSSERHLDTMQKLKTIHHQLDHMISNRHKIEKCLPLIAKALALTQETYKMTQSERMEFGAQIDFMIEWLTQCTLTSSKSTTTTTTTIHQRNNVLVGVEAVCMQLTTPGLLPPYNTIPRQTLLNALYALTAVSGRCGGGNNRNKSRRLNSTGYSVDKKNKNNNNNFKTNSHERVLDYSFRILQRLVTGVGVRQQSLNGTKIPFLSEKHFAMVLNAFVNAGQMDMAHRIVALQERTSHAPALSPVTYSILLKGYGRMHDLDNVELVLQKANRNKIHPDTVLLNTLMDAYIECNSIDKAKDVFNRMVQSTDMNDNGPMVNRRSYNTLLKGYAKNGDWKNAQALALTMKTLKLWDSITTNTLVHAAIMTRDLVTAKDVLEQHTLNVKKYMNQPNHPNVEAYTELLDAYAKNGDLDQALLILKAMKDRGVQPNEVTYTCLMGGLGRCLKIDLAKKTLTYMRVSGVQPTVKTYNALISALVGDSIIHNHTTTVNTTLETRVDEAMLFLREMISYGIRPDSVTVAVLVDALGRCHVPRLAEAELLIEQLESKQYLVPGDIQVWTSLVSVFGRSNDILGAQKSFLNIQRPDITAVNAYMDACNRCDQWDLVYSTFLEYCGKDYNLRPDVISYSIVIGSLLRNATNDSIQKARCLYHEMKSHANIVPDHGLIDIILKAMIHIAMNNARMCRADVYFVAGVIQDAEQMEWGEHQLEHRKKAVRMVFADRLREIWIREDVFESFPRNNDMDLMKDDALFVRKGWNKVDSGFRLWGGGSGSGNGDIASENKRHTKTPDQFLESHGWNDVQSGFRLF